MNNQEYRKVFIDFMSGCIADILYLLACSWVVYVVYDYAFLSTFPDLPQISFFKIVLLIMGLVAISKILRR